MLEWQLSELSYPVGGMKYVDLIVDGNIVSWWMTVELINIWLYSGEHCTLL